MIATGIGKCSIHPVLRGDPKTTHEDVVEGDLDQLLVRIVINLDAAGV